MARSFYKGPRLGKTPACALCLGPGQGPRAPFHLPGGVSVWLCAAHRDPEFTEARSGRDLIASLMHLWRSAGCLTRRRAQALELLERRRTGRRAPQPRPGSYAWPALRREAEAAFASGEPPGRVIARLRARHASSDARPPSVATMRRWFREGRWRHPGGGPAAAPPPTPPPPPPAPSPLPRPRPAAARPPRGTGRASGAAASPDVRAPPRDGPGATRPKMDRMSGRVAHRPRRAALPQAARPGTDP